MKKDSISTSYTRKYIEELSSKMESYNNNLDKLLNIKTRNTCRDRIKWNGDCRILFCAGCKYKESETKELRLEKNELIINNQNFDWYIIKKVEELDLFIIIGLLKNDSRICTVYRLGKDYYSNQTTLEKYYDKLTDSEDFLIHNFHFRGGSF